MKKEFLITLLASQAFVFSAFSQEAEPLSMTTPEVVEVQEEVFKSAPTVTEEVKFLNPEELTAATAPTAAEATVSEPEVMVMQDVDGEMFTLLDTDKNGLISAQEVSDYAKASAALDNQTPEQQADKALSTEVMLTKFDADQDGSLNPLEAKAFFKEYNHQQ